MAARLTRRSRDSERSLFCIATAPVAAEDRDAATELGRQLYGVLTRDADDPLAFGPGIPVVVAVDRIWDCPHWIAERAEHMLVVLVAGSSSLLLQPRAIRQRLVEFKSDGTHLQKLLMPTDPRWASEASLLGDVEVVNSVLDPNSASPAIDAILVSIGRYLGQIRARPTLYVSDRSGSLPNSDADLLIRGLGGKGASLLDYFAEIKEFSDREPRARPVSSASSTVSSTSGVLLTVRGGETNPRDFERDVIFAKKLGWPIVAVDSLSQSSRVTSPYTGNVPVINLGNGLQSLLRATVVEHLRHLHFSLLAQRVIRSAGLPINTAVLTRAPELMDMSSGVLREAATRMVLHPDPPLPPADREVLRTAAPLIHTITPSTLLGRRQPRNEADRLITPLDGLKIGLSVSDISAGEANLGQTEHHLQDVTIQAARTLISGGAGVTYGGDFSLGRVTSFTPLLANLVQTYNQSATRPAERLRLFQSADRPLDAIPKDVRCVARHLAESKDLADEAIFSASQVDTIPQGMLASDMRRAMTKETDARIAIGGQSQPRSDSSPGYSGRFPGVAEEVFRALAAEQPVYLCGGFGGMTRKLVQLLNVANSVDGFWNESNHADNQQYVCMAWNFDHHPKRDLLGLPRGLPAMADALAGFAQSLGDDDDAWEHWNGLSRAQNAELWYATDPILVSSLITDGLIRWRGLQVSRSGLHRVEAIRGDVTNVPRADVLAIPVFDDVDPQGAGAAVDRVTEGAVRKGQFRPGRLVGIRSDQLDVDYLCVFSLGSVNDTSIDQAALRTAIVNSAREMTELCRRQGFPTLAVVTFGGSTLDEYKSAVLAMLEGFGSATDQLVIKWIEQAKDKFAILVDTLREAGSVEVTTVLQTSVQQPRASVECFHLTINWRDDQLEITALPPAGTGLAWSNRSKLTEQDVNELTKGSGAYERATPNLAQLRERGLQLTQLIFGDNAPGFWRTLSDSAVAITHDEASSRIPFEILQFGGAQEPPSDDGLIGAPAVRGGLHRRLAIRVASTESLFGRPKLSGKLRVGLVINPTGDLDGARQEGHHLRSTLQAMSADIQLECLEEQEVTVARMKDLLQQVDVLHFCGHAQFDANQRGRSGLVLADRERLTARQLRRVSPLPRVLIFNACEAARVRGHSQESDPGSRSLAAFVLRAGVEAFVGTFWEVADKAAADFSTTVYQELTQGQTLRDAVTNARKQLAKGGQKDWANYVLYGDGRFRLT